MGHHRETDKTDKTDKTRQDRQDRQEQSPEARMEVWPSTGADRGTVTQARSLTVSSALLVRARRQSRRRTPTDQSRDVGNGTTPRAGHAPLRSAFSQSAVPLPTSTGPRVHGSTGPRVHEPSSPPQRALLVLNWYVAHGGPDPVRLDVPPPLITITIIR